MKKLLYVINIFRTGAVPNLLLDLAGHIGKKYSIRILSLQRTDPGDRLVLKCRKCGIPLDSLDMHRPDLWGTAVRLKKYLSGLKPDLIHSHLGRADVLSALCKEPKTKLVTTFHNIRSSYHPATRLGYMLSQRKTDIRTSVSRTVERSWYDDWLLKGRHCTIYNTVDSSRLRCGLEREEIRTQYGIGPDDILLLNLGRLTEQKGQVHLIEGMARVIRRVEKIKLLICGAGPYRGRLEKLIERLRLSCHVSLEGLVQNVEQLFKAADLFVITPLFEGHPVAVLEAMAARIPIVCSRAESLLEFLEDERDALFVESRNSEALADAIVRIAKDPQLRARLAENAYSKYENLFLPARIAAAYMDIYDSLTTA